MRFPKIIQNKKTKAEVTIYGKSKGGERKPDGSVTQPYPFYRICWRVAGQRRMQSFPTYSAAKQAAENLVRDLGTGSRVTVLTPGQANDALAALECLDGLFCSTGRRVSLFAAASEIAAAVRKLKERTVGDAVDGYLSNVATVKRVELKEAVEQFIASRKPKTIAKDGKPPGGCGGITCQLARNPRRTPIRPDLQRLHGQEYARTQSLHHGQVRRAGGGITFGLGKA